MSLYTNRSNVSCKHDTTVVLVGVYTIYCETLWIALIAFDLVLPIQIHPFLTTF